jgi:membrane associated rhomboid family serine protease
MRQLVLDASALLLVGTVAEREFGTRLTALLLLLGMPLLSIALLALVPDLVQYRGASGVVTMLAFAAGSALWRRVPKLRIILAVLGLAMTAKTVLDSVGWTSDLSSLPAGIQVAWQAHALGAAMGLVAGRMHRFNPV